MNSIRLLLLMSLVIGTLTTDVDGQDASKNAGKLQFQFHEADWKQVLGWLSEEANLTVQFIDVPESSVNLLDWTDKKYTRQAAIDLFSDLLVEEGYGVIRKGRRFVVASIEKQENRGTLKRRAPLVTLEDLDQFHPAQIIRHPVMIEGVISAKNEKALSADLRPFLNPAGDISWIPGTKRVYIVDTVERILALRQHLESQSITRVERVRLLNRPAAVVFKEIEPFLARAKVGARAGNKGGAVTRVSIADDGASLLVGGDREDRTRVVELIQLLDQEDPAQRSVDSVTLSGLDPRNLVSEVSALLAAAIPTSGGAKKRPNVNGNGRSKSIASGAQPALLLDSTGSRLWFAGTLWQNEKIHEIIEKMKMSSRVPVANQVRVIPQNNAKTLQAIALANRIWGESQRDVPVILRGDSAANGDPSTMILTGETSLVSAVQRTNEDRIQIRVHADQVIFNSRDSAELTEYFEIVEAMLRLVPDFTTDHIDVSHRAPSELVVRIQKIMETTPSAPTPSLDHVSANALNSSVSGGPSMQPPAETHPRDTPQLSEAGSESTGGNVPSRPNFRESIAGVAPRGDIGMALLPMDEFRQIYVRGTEEQHVIVRRLVALLDQPEEETRLPTRIGLKHRTLQECIDYLRMNFGKSVTIVPLGDATGELVESEVPTIISDEATDSLLISGTRAERREIQLAVSLFDEPSKQSQPMIGVVSVSSPLVGNAIESIFSEGELSDDDYEDSESNGEELEDQGQARSQDSEGDSLDPQRENPSALQ